MKRGGPPRRKTPLRQRAPLARKPAAGLVVPDANQGKYTGPPGSDLLVTEVARPGRKRRRRVRSVPFPPAVAAQLDTRDEWCQRDGKPGPLHRHHRRAKGMGGDTRPHTQCACNGIKLCLACHIWVHANPERATAEGWIVSEEVCEPGRVSVMRGTEDGGGATMWPACDGQWAAESPWTERAA